MELRSEEQRKFKRVSDIPAYGFTERFVLGDDGDENQIVVGKYAVLFGFRLRGGFVDMDNHDCSACELDICCGDNRQNYENMLFRVQKIILNNPIDNPFLGIPTYSKIKPYYNDPDFCKKIEYLLNAQ